eukprot:gene28699-37687_t
MGKRSRSSTEDCRNRKKEKIDSRDTTSSGDQYSAFSDESKDDEVGHFVCGNGDFIKNRRYRLDKEIGKGTFGKVFQCYDTKREKSLAVKVIRSIKKYIESAQIEADILDDVFEQQKRLEVEFCVKMYASFRFDGHYCLVFERLGLSLFDLVKKNDYKPFPLRTVKAISKQLLEALHFLKRINLIHTDLKLENVLFVGEELEECTVKVKGKRCSVFVPRDLRIKLIDFGGATYDNDARKSTVVNTRQYRGPEVILEIGWSFPSDVWSAGCIIAEIFNGDLLFQTHGELEHLALIEKCVGLFPLSMIRRSKYEAEFFSRGGVVKTQSLPKDSQKFVSQMASLQDFCIENNGDRQFEELLKSILRIDPRDRLTAREALDLPVFQSD